MPCTEWDVALGTTTRRGFVRQEYCTIVEQNGPALPMVETHKVLLGVCAVEDSVDEIIKKLQAFRQIEGQPKYDFEVYAFAVDVSCSIQDLVRGPPIVPSLILIELHLFKTNMMGVIKKLIGAPLSSPNLAPKAGDLIVQIVEDTFAHTGPLVENLSNEPHVEDDMKSGSNVLGTNKSLTMEEIVVHPVGISDDAFVIVTDHVPINDVDEDAHHQDREEVFGNNLIVYGCTESFGMLDAEVIVICKSGTIAPGCILFIELVACNYLTRVGDVVGPTCSFDAPITKVLDPGGWTMNGVIFSRSLFDFQLEDKLVFEAGRVIRVYI
ncbi:unnamed protein product [Cuscuta campestris]|uniref:Uncharacterized protein n=1 Tax=Cuscuta campestris TaxID=132261 RepID=A0A484M0M4_9ASTE|nr:unnamed protein product [Cuscuta campestris]